jgi:two-component system cell cycle response regulator
VVFLTGRTGTDDVVEGLRLGAHDYLKKPFEPSELIARVSAAVRMKTVQDELRARNAELDRISRTDMLTGLANRRHTEERLRELIASCMGGAGALAVVLFDIDHFKHINDTFGHAGGDAVLREFAARLRSRPRDGEVQGRWGGEEFLVVLPEATAEEARAFAEQIRVCVEAEPFGIDNEVTATITISGGCAKYRGDDPDDLVRRADDALYRAKEAGRNRVLLADDLPASAPPGAG